MRYAAYTFATVALVWTVSLAVYLIASFVLMRRHVGERPHTHTLREFAREALWASLVQLLVPLYYVVGRHMGGGGDGTPIVFVHGYMQNRADFVGLARALRGMDAPLYGFNYPWWGRVEKNAARLGRFVESVCAETGRARVALVAHSLGGLVALEYTGGPEGAARVSRCVTIASPHAGIRWRGPMIGPVAAQMRRTSPFLLERSGRPVSGPTFSIYSTHDNLVHPRETASLTARGGRDLVVPHVGHLAILFDREVAAAVAGFLAEAG